MAKKAQESVGGPGAVDAAEMQIDLQIPSGVVSQYVNHVTLQTRGTGTETETTLGLWQVPVHAVNSEENRATAFLVGSYVVPAPLVEQLARGMAKQLGYRLTARRTRK
jgi:hypothetical protein